MAYDWVNDYRSLREDVVLSFRDYVIAGVPTGGFLRYVLENKLVEAVGKADAENMRVIPVIASYVYNRIPVSAWGSEAKVDAWIARGGLRGRGESLGVPFDAERASERLLSGTAVEPKKVTNVV